MGKGREFILVKDIIPSKIPEPLDLGVLPLGDVEAVVLLNIKMP